MEDDISAIQFGILGADAIRNMSVVEIVCHDVMEKGLPKHGGLSDLRLGTIDRQFRCHTCKQNAISCPGHFGHIDLAQPMYHINFIKTVGKVLQCVCVCCSKLKDDYKVRANEKRPKKFKAVHEALKSKMVCSQCSHEQPKVTVDKHDIYFEYEEKQKLSAQDCLKILQRIDEATCTKLGFHTQSPPSHMIFDAFPVPPPHIRPSVNMDAALKSQDDLTHKLSEIVKTNNLIKRSTDHTSQTHAGLLELLQYHITTYIDNNTSGISPATQRTGRPIKSITQRLKSKEGRIRGNIMGKRVNFSARTVITAEPNLDLDQLGVPWEIAKTLSFPETVTSFNMKRLQQYVDAGPNPKFGHTGAKTVTHDGMARDLRFVQKPTLHVGDIVERHLQDDDIVVFNRQPSLHKMSMMGHRIKVMKGSTFRMNVCATTPYNADFDGDEMNLHAPQSHAAISEVKELMMVPHNIVSPQSNKPVIGIIQDALLGAHRFSLNEVFITSNMLCDMCMKASIDTSTLPQPAILKPTRLYTGKQVVQMLLPKDFRFNRAGQVDHVHISNGVYHCGTLCKKSLGTSEGGIIHMLWLNYGKDAAVSFISNLQYVVNYWLQCTGFSIGAMDIFPGKTTESAVACAIADSKDRVEAILKICNDKSLDPGDYEAKINQILNNAMSQSGLIIQNNLSRSNNINTTVTSGSKGSMFNIAQIMGCVGQQNVSGQRVNFGYIDRVLPHFARKDVSPAAKGFVESSYKNGLKPHEFFYHAMGGREGIIDTAIKTSETGYIQRRLIKAMEDITVASDGSLRNSIGDVVQYIYGGDGFDPTYLQSVYVKHNDPDSFVYDGIDQREADSIRDAMNHLHGDTSAKLPFNAQHIVQAHVDNGATTPQAHYERVQQLVDVIHSGCMRSATQSMALCVASIWNELSSKHTSSCLSPYALDKVCTTIEHKVRRARVQQGEMVGTIAAQSIGEPCTQLTLNTFHAAGISAKNVTLGVPRFKELINVSKTLKSPSMTLVLKEPYANSADADIVACDIERVSLQNVITDSTICKTDDVQDRLTYMEIPDELENSYFDHCIVYSLDPKHISKYRLSLLDISLAIMQEYETLHCVGDERRSQLLVFVYSDTDLQIEALKMLNAKLKTQHLRGSTNVTKVYIKEGNSTLETDGCCFIEALRNSCIDPYKSFCNDLYATRDTLGIEAARSLLLSELRKVIEFDGTYVNMKHFITLVDVMTNKGGLMSITRHGINKSDNAPLMKCSFEETVDVLTEAAAYYEKDLLKGVTENITVGKIANIGTGNMGLVFDYDAQYNTSCAHNQDCASHCDSYTPLDIVTDDDYFSSVFTDDDVDSYF